MLHRFTHAVQGGVSKVSGAVQNALQDEITKSFDMPKDNTASGGHECLWKVYPGICKRTQAEVSIFIFDKDLVKKQPREVQEKIIDAMRQDMKTLRVLRHPHVLRVTEVFEETKHVLAFATEKIVCSLANANRNFTNVGNITPDIMDVGCSEFELACGLMHLGEALSFLHREGRRVHLALSPTSIFLTPKGEWKLAGLGFSRSVEPGASARSEFFMGEAPSMKDTSVMPLRYDPPMEYCAPELMTEPRQFNQSADMFALGLLVWELCLPPSSDGTRSPILDLKNSSSSNPVNHAYKVQSLYPLTTFDPSIPPSLHPTIRALLQHQPSDRLEARSFLSSEFFDAGPVKTLRALMNLVELDPADQAKFLSTLAPMIESYPPRILRDMVLPGIQTVVRNEQVAPFGIPPLLKIVEILDKSTFGHTIAPMLAPLLALSEPVQVMLMFATNLEILVPKSEEGFIRDHVVPMLCRALDSNVPEILDTVLNKIVDQASLFEYRILKQVILPRVTKLILEPPQMTVRVNALLWLAKSYHVFDKDLLVESVLPTLSQVLKLDQSPAVCMCVLGCYDNLGKYLGTDFIAQYILPAVAPLLVEKTLTEAQFDIVCQRMHTMVAQVIKERGLAFESQNKVKSVSSGLDHASGIGAAVQAARVKKEKQSGAAAAKAMLDASANIPPSSSTSVQDHEDEEDPFTLGSSKHAKSKHAKSKHAKSKTTPYRDHPSQDENEGDAKVSYAERRKAKKKVTKKVTTQRSSDLLDLPAAPPVSSSSSSSGLFEHLSLAPTPVTNMAPIQMMNNHGNSSMFQGMNMNTSATSGMMPPTTSQVGMHNMNTYGGVPQQQQMTMYNNNMPGQNQPQYNQNAGSMGNVGSLLQIQNGPTTSNSYHQSYPPPPPHMGGNLQIQNGGYQPQQQTSGNKFSAFDGL